MAAKKTRYPRYKAVARKLWPGAAWIEAKPRVRSPWATVSHCYSGGKPALTVKLHPSVEASIAAFWYWPDDDTDQPARLIACGGSCLARVNPEMHAIVPLSVRAVLDSLRPLLKLRGA